MAEDQAPTERPSPIKKSSLPGFLPLNDTAVTTRGQTLPSLIRVRSSLGVEDLKKRRRIRIEGEIDGEDDNDGDLESNAESFDSGRDLLVPSIRNGSTSWRKGSVMSDIGSILNTPQMRSMRLIGKPNPEYQWERYYKTESELKRMKKPMCASELART